MPPLGISNCHAVRRLGTRVNFLPELPIIALPPTKTSAKILSAGAPYHDQPTQHCASGPGHCWNRKRQETGGGAALNSRQVMPLSTWQRLSPVRPSSYAYTRWEPCSKTNSPPRFGPTTNQAVDRPAASQRQAAQDGDSVHHRTVTPCTSLRKAMNPS